MQASGHVVDRKEFTDLRHRVRPAQLSPGHRLISSLETLSEFRVGHGGFCKFFVSSLMVPRKNVIAEHQLVTRLIQWTRNPDTGSHKITPAL